MSVPRYRDKACPSVDNFTAEELWQEAGGLLDEIHSLEILLLPYTLDVRLSSHDTTRLATLWTPFPLSFSYPQITNVSCVEWFGVHNGADNQAFMITLKYAEYKSHVADGKGNGLVATED